MGEAWKYGYDYTQKDTADVRKLNDYELSHHLYACFRKFDEGDSDEMKAEGKKLVNECFEEFERRGCDGIIKRRV